MKKTLYYAVSGSGVKAVFVSEPVRNDKRMIWEGDIDAVFSSLVMQMVAEGFLLPVLTWKDEPVKIELDLNIAV